MPKKTKVADQIEALRATLREHLDAVQRIEPLMERIRKLQLKADEIGKLDPAFDMKKFTDEMWGDS